MYWSVGLYKRLTLVSIIPVNLGLDTKNHDLIYRGIMAPTLSYQLVTHVIAQIVSNGLTGGRYKRNKGEIINNTIMSKNKEIYVHNRLYKREKRKNIRKDPA